MFTKTENLYLYTNSLMSKPKLSSNATKSQGFWIWCSHPSTDNKFLLLGLCVVYCARIGCKWPLELVRSSSPSTRSLLMFFLFSMQVCCGVYHLPCITQIIFELRSFLCFLELAGTRFLLMFIITLQNPIMHGFISFLCLLKLQNPKKSSSF